MGFKVQQVPSSATSVRKIEPRPVAGTEPRPAGGASQSHIALDPNAQKVFDKKFGPARVVGNSIWTTQGSALPLMVAGINLPFEDHMGRLREHNPSNAMLDAALGVVG